MTSSMDRTDPDVDTPSDVSVRPCALAEVEPFRRAMEVEVDAQIVHYSILPRRLADPFLFLLRGRPVGYAGVWNRYAPGRIMEIFVTPGSRHASPALLRALAVASGASELEAQTNIPLMDTLLRAQSTPLVVAKRLFDDAARDPGLDCSGASFRRRRPEDEGPEGEWVVEIDGEVVAGGGALTHYNEPWADLYMEVRPGWRRQGIGAWLVQELVRMCRRRGFRPAARCDPDHEASVRTLLRGGLSECGALRWARLSPVPIGRPTDVLAPP